MTWRQLQEWMAYDLISPIGDRRGDWQAAAICAAVANVMMAVNRGRKRFNVSDFLLEFGKVVKRAKDVEEGKSWQEMKFIAQMCAAASRAEKIPRR